MRLSEKLRVLRKAKGYTQSDLAKFSGVSLGSIKRYETEECNITHKNLLKLARALDAQNELLNCPINEEENLSHKMSHNGKISQNLSHNHSKLKIPDPKYTFYDYEELFALIMDFATPKMLEKWKKQLLEIKRLSEDDQ